MPARKSILLMIPLWLCCIAITGCGNRLDVLFIGNSYTYSLSMPALVAALAREAPKPIRIRAETVTVGGATLEQLLSLAEVKEAVSRRTWDWVVLQEQSLRPIHDRNAMFAAAEGLDALIRKSGSKTMLYMTWARKNHPDMQEVLTAAYLDLGRNLNAPVVPVGEAWRQVSATDSWIELYDSDGSHPGRNGAYLTACVFVAALTGQDPGRLPSRVNVDGLDFVVSERVAGKLRRAAAAVTKSP